MFVRLCLLVLAALALWVALARPSEGAAHEGVYVVKPSDTLWAIAAARYAGDPREAVWRLRERNHLDGATIRPGQRLVLPAG